MLIGVDDDPIRSTAATITDDASDLFVVLSTLSYMFGLSIISIFSDVTFPNDSGDTIAATEIFELIMESSLEFVTRDPPISRRKLAPRTSSTLLSFTCCTARNDELDEIAVLIAPNLSSTSSNRRTGNVLFETVDVFVLDTEEMYIDKALANSEEVALGLLILSTANS